MFDIPYDLPYFSINKILVNENLERKREKEREIITPWTLQTVCDKFDY